MSFLYILIALLTISLVFLFNRKMLGIEHSHHRASLLNGLSSKKRIIKKSTSIFYKLGKLSSVIYPDSFLQILKRKTSFVSRAETELYINIGQGKLSSLAMLAVYSINHIEPYLFLAIIMPIAFIAEIFIAEIVYKRSLDQAVPHVISCIKVLIVETETPLINALNIITNGLPSHMKALKEEINKILEKAKQSSITETLSSWETDSKNFKDFLSLLISSYEGASKSALKVYINNFESRIKEDNQENIKNQSENLQLYLIGPIIIMFLIIIQPMVSAINHAMSNGFQ